MLIHKGGKNKNWGGECRDVTPTKWLSQNIRVDVNTQRSEAFVKIKKKYFFFGGGGGGGGASGRRGGGGWVGLGGGGGGSGWM